VEREIALTRFICEGVKHDAVHIYLTTEDIVNYGEPGS